MLRTKNLLAITLAAGLFTTASQADTIAQYTFEENAPGTVDSGQSGAQLLDSSGNGLHFTKTSNPGSLTWAADIASVQPAGSTSMKIGNPSTLDTVAADFSFASNPTMTIEFWYKPDLTDTLRYILDSGDGANAWLISQEVPGTQGAAAGSFNIEFSYADNANTFRTINTATTFSTNTAENDWTHIAVVVNRVAGDIAIYFNGVEDASTAGVDENIDSFTFGSKTGALRLGSLNTAPGFTNRAFIDDLRISSDAFAPGQGSGIDELAWNASLIPEPASMALVGLGSAALVFRGRGVAKVSDDR